MTKVDRGGASKQRGGAWALVLAALAPALIECAGSGRSGGAQAPASAPSASMSASAAPSAPHARVPLVGWVDGSASSISVHMMWGEGAHLGARSWSAKGCPAPPTALRTCPANVDALSVDQLLSRAESLAGQVVTVRGPFGQTVAGTTMLGGQSWASMAINPERRTHLGRISLGSKNGGFECYGDGSLMCCGFASRSGEAIARGTLVVLHGYEGWRSVGLDDACVCDPDSHAGDGPAGGG